MTADRHAAKWMASIRVGLEWLESLLFNVSESKQAQSSKPSGCTLPPGRRGLSEILLISGHTRYTLDTRSSLHVHESTLIEAHTQKPFWNAIDWNIKTLLGKVSQGTLPYYFKQNGEMNGWKRKIKADKDISSIVWTHRISMQQLCNNKVYRLSRFQRSIREVHLMLL